MKTVELPKHPHYASFSSRGARGTQKLLTLKIVRILLEGPATIPEIVVQTQASDPTIRDTVRIMRDLRMLRIVGWECDGGRPSAVYELTVSGQPDALKPDTAVPAADRNRRSRAKRKAIQLGMFAQLLNT